MGELLKLGVGCKGTKKRGCGSIPGGHFGLPVGSGLTAGVYGRIVRNALYLNS